MRMNQANRISINQYHLGRRMNYVPGEEYFSCIVLRRTGIGPFDFGWWASSSWNDLETWKSSRKARPVLSSATLQTRALLIYLGRLAAPSPWHHRAGERVGTAIEQGRQSPTFKPNWAFAFFCSVPRFHAPPQTNRIYQLTPSPRFPHVRLTLLFPNAATTKPSPGTKSTTGFVTC